MIKKTVVSFSLIVKILKKLYLFSITIVMFVLLTACSQVKLNEYEETAKITLDTYVEAKKEDNIYYGNNLLEITFADSHCKEAIDAAKTKSAVDKAVATAISTIDQVYVIQISLDDELRLYILDLYHSWIISEFGDVPSSEAEHFVYYGQYNGFYVLNFPGWYFSYYTEFIDDLDFPVLGLAKYTPLARMLVER